MSSSNTMSSEESLSVRSISVDVETPETEQVMATVADLAKLGLERSAAAAAAAATADGNGDCLPLSPPDVSLHSVPRGGSDCLDDQEVSTDATPVEENNEGGVGGRGTIPFESISKMSTTSSSGSEGEEEEGDQGRGEIRAR